MSTCDGAAEHKLVPVSFDCEWPSWSALHNTVPTGSALPASLGRAELDEWCRRWLGSVPMRTLFTSGNLSAVIGVRLTDGRGVVIKARRPAARLPGCVEVQRHLWAAGFPCPRPLAGPAPLGALTATAESYVPGGEQLAPSRGAPRRFAGALAWLIEASPPVGSVLPLDPPPAWLRWNHDLTGPWPRPESTPADLNTLTGPRWLDEVGQRVRGRLARFDAASVVGHADFESQNLRWHGDQLHVVHDWDSVVALPEAVIVGAAAATYPATGRTARAASVLDSRRFLEAYAHRRARAWSAGELQVCWAAGLWVLGYNAKVELAEGGDALQERLTRDVGQRLELAGA